MPINKLANHDAIKVTFRGVEAKTLHRFSIVRVGTDSWSHSFPFNTLAHNQATQDRMSRWTKISEAFRKRAKNTSGALKKLMQAVEDSQKAAKESARA